MTFRRQQYTLRYAQDRLRNGGKGRHGEHPTTESTEGHGDQPIVVGSRTKFRAHDRHPGGHPQQVQFSVPCLSSVSPWWAVAGVLLRNRRVHGGRHGEHPTIPRYARDRLRHGEHEGPRRTASGGGFSHDTPLAAAVPHRPPTTNGSPPCLPFPPCLRVLLFSAYLCLRVEMCFAGVNVLDPD